MKTSLDQAAEIKEIRERIAKRRCENFEEIRRNKLRAFAERFFEPKPAGRARTIMLEIAEEKNTSSAIAAE